MRQLTESTILSDQTVVIHGYELDGWVLRLTALSDHAPAQTMNLLTRAVVGCGGWVLTRAIHEEGFGEMDFEFARAGCVEIYAGLVACGLELSRESHLQMAELCQCTKNLMASKAFDIARVDLVIYQGQRKASYTDGDTLSYPA
jgi:hypothetical protein